MDLQLLSSGKILSQSRFILLTEKLFLPRLLLVSLVHEDLGGVGPGHAHVLVRPREHALLLERSGLTASAAPPLLGGGTRLLLDWRQLPPLAPGVIVRDGADP